MADTGEQRYSKKESLNRIYRVLIGEQVASDTPDTVPGIVLSEDEAMSKIAEILAGDDPSHSLTPPTSLQEDFGLLFITTGTVTLTALPNTAYTTLTGTWQGAGEYDGAIPQAVFHRVYLTKAGTYFVDWNISFQGSSAITYTFAPHLDATEIIEAKGSVTPNASGSSTNVSGHGDFAATANSNLYLKVLPSASAWMKPLIAQLRVRRVED